MPAQARGLDPAVIYPKLRYVARFLENRRRVCRFRPMSFVDCQERTSRPTMLEAATQSMETKEAMMRAGPDGSAARRRAATDGPYAESKELVMGHWPVAAASRGMPP